jgi:hypothetical protein
LELLDVVTNVAGGGSNIICILPLQLGAAGEHCPHNPHEGYTLKMGDPR